MVVPRIDGRGKEVMRRRDGVDVSRHVQVEILSVLRPSEAFRGPKITRFMPQMASKRVVSLDFLHGEALRMAAARRAALDAEGRPHGGLADVGHHLASTMENALKVGEIR